MDVVGSASKRTPALLIHGAFAGAWIWDGAFLDGFAKSGRLALALDLRNEIGLDKKERSDTNYDAVILQALEKFQLPPVVIAHSLGALLAQRLLGRVNMSALVMLAPVPPEGMMFMTPSLFAAHPSLWQGLWGFLTGERESAFAAMENIIFSRKGKDVPLTDQTSKLVFENPRVLIEAHIPTPVMPAFLAGIPTLVIAGREDRLISSCASARTALYHGAEYQSEDEIGHFMPQEPGGARVADFVVDWLDRKNL